MNTMTLTTSTLLVAVGAVMRFAISAQGKGFNVHMIGSILMIVGIVGAVVAIGLYAMSSKERTAALQAPGTVVVEQHEVRQP
jgi:hypothetical protein